MPLLSDHPPRFIPMPVSSVAIVGLDAAVQVAAGEQRCGTYTHIVHVDWCEEVVWSMCYGDSGRIMGRYVYYHYN